MPETFGKDLNPAQREAVEYGEGPLLVVAGAGTGKTTMLAHRVARLVADGARPDRILLLTFTRRAAMEMLQRAKRLLETVKSVPTQSQHVSNVWGGTFHAVGTRLLRIYGSCVGLPQNFTIIDRADQEDLMNLVRTETLGKTTDGKRFPKKGTLVSIYSRCVNSQAKLYDILSKYYPKLEEYLPELAKIFDAYTQRKIENATLDYDDLLLYWSAMMRHPEIGEKIRSRFDWVLVDEYQDTNRIQAEIVQGLTPDGKGLTVVGDDAQSIYSFRAATVRNILDFPKTFPGAKIIPL
ncbi:MAG: ATP-dependent helicase, partial [Thermoguttaceae bacterium]